MWGIAPGLLLVGVTATAALNVVNGRVDEEHEAIVVEGRRGNNCISLLCLASKGPYKSM